MEVRSISCIEMKIIDDIVSIHLDTFQGFFLSFMGRGFLKLMYCSYVEHINSGILVSFENEKPIGFLAYSSNLSGLYKYMLKKKVIQFAWYSVGAFLRKPSVFMRLVRAFLKPSEAKRKEKYIELASIGVTPNAKSKGVGSQLIETLKSMVNFNEFAYIKLETDAINNEVANHFYLKNGFIIEKEFETSEGRKMFEYRYRHSLEK